MVDELAVDRVLDAVSELADQAGPGVSSGLLLELAANLIRLVVMAQIDSFKSHLWLAAADLRAPESVQPQYRFSLSQGSLSPVLADLERLHAEIARLGGDAVAATDEMVADYLAAASETQSGSDVTSEPARKLIAGATQLGRVGVRLLGTCIHLVGLLPEERWPLLLFAGTSCARAVQADSEAVRTRFQLIGQDSAAHRMDDLDAVVSLCKERLAHLQRISTRGH